MTHDIRLLKVTIVLASVASFALGAFAQSQRPEKRHDEPTITRPDKEQAALESIRLGINDVMLVCAYEEGLARVPRPLMFRACTINYGIGEPTYSYRRQDAK